jgi:hypothetical protein
MINFIKKFYYIGIIIGLVILAIAIYTAGGNSAALKELLKRKPKKDFDPIKLPEKPTMIDFIEVYKNRLKDL